MAAFTSDGFYRSGDLARAHRIDGRTAYSIEGRVKDLIDRGGEKINAEEVETLLIEHDAVREAALVSIPGPRLGERACAYVVPADAARPPTLSELCAFLETRGVTKFKWPEHLECVDSLPRTQIGKVSKARLREAIREKLNIRSSETSGDLPGVGAPPTA